MSRQYNECAPGLQEIELDQAYCEACSETCSESLSSGPNYSGHELEGIVTDHNTCSESLSSGSNYSGHELEGIVTDHNQFQTPQPASTAHTINMRRHLRIFCRNARACIRTESASVIATLTNVSRNGLGFRTSEKFNPGTTVSIATHYVEGGENIFQSGRIVRVRLSPSGNFADYGVEF